MKVTVITIGCLVAMVGLLVGESSGLTIVVSTTQRCWIWWGSRTLYDRCGQRCRCVGGRLVECTRIRKEFTSMSHWERRRYIRVIKTASTDPKYKPEYDRLLTVHRGLFLTQIHEQRHFLTWHRWFVLQYENLLRKIDCRVTVAYWDWSLVSANPWRTTSRDVWYAGSSGYGGNGTSPDQCVRKGPFRQGQWNLVPSAGGGCLRRRFNGNTPDAVAVEEVLRTPAHNFNDFEVALRINLHDNIHCLIDGTMCSLDSATAPEFFLHHGFIDKIWADWQKRSSAHKNAFFPGINERLPSTTYNPSQLIDLNDQPGGVRVEYRNPVQFTDVYGFLTAQSIHQLQRIRRVGFQAINLKAVKLFKVKASDMRVARKMALRMVPKRRVRISFKIRTKGTTTTLGFQIHHTVVSQVTRFSKFSHVKTAK